MFSTVNGCESDHRAEIRLARLWGLCACACEQVKQFAPNLKGRFFPHWQAGAKRAADDSCHPLFSSPFKSISITGMAPRALGARSLFIQTAHSQYVCNHARHTRSLSERDSGEKSGRVNSQQQGTATDTYPDINFDISWNKARKVSHSNVKIRETEQLCFGSA